MRRKKWDTLPEEVERVRERFAQWRQTRAGRSRIPDELWSAAVELSGRHGVYRIARVLGLNDHTLGRRRQETLPSLTEAEAEASSASRTAAPDQDGWAPKPSGAPAPTLIELPWPAPPISPTACCRIELRHPGGAQMTITLEGAGGAAPPCGLDLAALVRAFGGGSP